MRTVRCNRLVTKIAMISNLGRTPKPSFPKQRFELLAAALRPLCLCLLLLAALPKPAHAYTDPGTGALIWQMLVAGFVGAMFYFRRFTGWFRDRKKGDKLDQ